MNMDSDDDMNIEALEELLGSNSADMEEIEKNAELDEADAAFFDQLEDQIEDLSGFENGETAVTTMNLDFTEPDEYFSNSNLVEEPTHKSAPVENTEKNPENTTIETPENSLFDELYPGEEANLVEEPNPLEESNSVEDSRPVEEAMQIVTNESFDSLPGSSHSMVSQTLDSDDERELMNNPDEPIDQLLNALKEEEETMESAAVNDVPASQSASSLSKSIDVFSKLLPSHSVDGSTNLSADLQATAKALAAVSPNFEIGVKGKQSGLFGRFRRSGAPVASYEEREKEETKVEAEVEEADGDSIEKASKEPKTGFLGAFRVKSKPDHDTVTEAEESGKDEKVDAEKAEEESTTEVDSNPRMGFFGAFRASQKSQAQESTAKEEETSNDTDTDDGENYTETDSSAKGGLFGAFRAIPKSDNQDSSKEENTDSETGKEEENGTSPRFFSVFRGKVSQSTEHTNGGENNHDIEEKEGQNGNTETDSSSGGGFFGAFRASPKSDTSATPGDSENVEEGKTTSKPATLESSSGSRFNVFRKFGETKKAGQMAANLSPFEEADTDDSKTKEAVTSKSPAEENQVVVENPAEPGPGMFSYVSRKREEWNRRGTIDFPRNGPYLERTVRVGKLLTEGSFASVFHATHYDDSETLYVLKRINVLNDATREACERESIICNVLSDQKECIIPMLGYLVDEEHSVCYMLFPFMHMSLQAEIDIQFAKEGLPEIPPWDEKVALYMFYLLLHAVDALHGIGYTHRNIQVENIYLSSWKRPVLSGFRNAGPLSRSCSSAKDIFEIANTASKSINMAYRPPELFPGALMVGHDPLKYCLVDCWSLGCTLFAILYGVSPFECSFDPETGAMLKQECNQLSILADIPFPPAESPAGKWYSDEVKELILLILEKDRAKRPSLAMIQAKVSSLLTQGVDPATVQDVSETTDMEDFQS